MLNKIHEIIIIVVLLVIALVILGMLIYSRSKNPTNSGFNGCKTLKTKESHCKSMKANIGTCNTMIKKFFEDEGVTFLENYLDDPPSSQPGILVAEYDFTKGKVVPVIPIEIYNKILNSKLRNKNDDNVGISVFVGQGPIFESDVADALQIYHTALVFVETSKYDPDEEISLKNILFCMELLVQTGLSPVGMASCLYPKVKDNKLDISYQSVSKIVIEFPEAFGCIADGGYWENRYKYINHVGDTTKSVVKSLYNESIKWFGNNWAYVATTLVSEPCYGTNIPQNVLMGITCGTFVQAMCALLYNKYPDKFEGLFDKIAWNDSELVGEWERVDLTNDENVKAIGKYMVELNKTIKQINDGTLILNSLNNEYVKENTGKSKYILNVQIGSVMFPKIIKSIVKSDEPYMYVTGFENGVYNVYKIKISPPYLQSVFDICPGLMYDQEYKKLM